MIVPDKKILWISRHSMTDEQENDLIRIYKHIEITKYDRTISSAGEIRDAGDYDVYAVVLTAELIASLKKILPPEKEILQPVSERIFTGRTIVNPATGAEEKEYEYKHRCWRKVIKAEFETVEL